MAICFIVVAKMRADPARDNAPTQALSLVVFLSALGLLLGTLTHWNEQSRSLLPIVLGASALAILPLATVWALATSFANIRARVARLSFLQTAPGALGALSDGALGQVPLLGLFIASACVLPLVGKDLALFDLAFGIAWSTAFALLAVQLSSHGSKPFAQEMDRLSLATDEAQTLDLEAANRTCEAAIKSKAWRWLLVSLLPPITVVSIHQLDPAHPREAWGVAAGLSLFGAGHAWLKQAEERTQQTLGLLSLAGCSIQLLLITLLMSSS
jgi:hypothetical protein